MPIADTIDALFAFDAMPNDRTDGPPLYAVRNNHEILSFDTQAAVITGLSCDWSSMTPYFYGRNGLSFIVNWVSTVTTGDVVFNGYLEKLPENTALGSSAFSSAVSAAPVTVSSTSGNVKRSVIRFPEGSSDLPGPGEPYRFRLELDNNGTTAAGSVQVLVVEVCESHGEDPVSYPLDSDLPLFSLGATRFRPWTTGDTNLLWSKVNGRPYAEFPEEDVYIVAPVLMPRRWITTTGYFRMVVAQVSGAVTGNVERRLAMERIGEDNQDIDTDSFFEYSRSFTPTQTANLQESHDSLPSTSFDGMVGGDYGRVRIRRYGSSIGDTLGTNLRFFGITYWMD